MSVITKDLGAVSAYGLALEAGFEGTEQEYAELLASYGTVAQEAGESAANAAQAANATGQLYGQTALARDAAISAKDNAVSARDTAAEAANVAGRYASEAEAAQAAAESAKDTAVNAVDGFAAGAQQALDSVNEAGGNWKSLAERQAGNSEAWAVGQRSGVDVPTTDATYHNNAKYYAEQASGEKTAAQTARQGAETAATNASQSATAAATSASQAAESARTLTIDTTLTQSGQAADAKVVGDALETKAKIDGSYESMTVGNAEQLVSSRYTVDNEPYLYRTSGGTADIGDREYDEIVGGSVVWNQLADLNAENWKKLRMSMNFSGLATSLTPTSNSTTALKSAYIDAISNHKYLISGKYNAEASNFGITIGVYQNVVSNVYSWRKFISLDSTDVVFAEIVTVPNDTSYISFTIATSATTENFVVIDNLMIFDLTQMFGSEIADYVYNLEQTTPGAGVAWFRKYFPNDYYEYNTGELKHVEGLSAHEMVGFNQFDKSTALNNSMINASGEIVSGLYTVSDFIHVIPLATYYVKSISPGTATLGIAVYDANKEYIASFAPGGSNSATSGLVTIPANAHYLRLATTTPDECGLNLSLSGWRDGEYEPYAKHSYPLDSSLTLRGIPKLSADGKLYFDGDRYASDGTVTRNVYEEDLGNCNWQYNSQYDVFYTTTNANKRIKREPFIQGYKGTNKSGNQLADKESTTTGTFAIGNIIIKDTSFNGDASAFKTSLLGTVGIFALKEPTTETALAYQSPQIVDDFGTEEYVSTGIVPVGHETKYLANLRDKIQHLPDLAASDGYYVIQQTGHDMSLVHFRIPQAPTTDGTYTLKATVTGGAPTYTWEGVTDNEG